MPELAHGSLSSFCVLGLGQAFDGSFCGRLPGDYGAGVIEIKLSGGRAVG